MKVTLLLLYALPSFCQTTTNGIHWQDLSVQTASNVTLLQPISGFIAFGELCGIIGPSGSGKSTFLRALGGRTSNLELDGTVWWHKNGHDETSIDENDDTSTSVAMLQQHDVFFGMLTTKETLELASYLEFPSKTKRERDNLVSKTIHSLGLALVQNRKIGDKTLPGAKGGGLSGGEQRRLSLALEMLGKPRLFLADEATTGLDSTQANKVVRLIADFAKERNIPALLSLHQPRASIWKMLDRIILLAPNGKVCFMGKRTDALSYFHNLGYDCPEETNPAEFLIDLVSVDTEDAEQGKLDDMRIDKLAEIFKTYSQAQRTDAPTIDSIVITLKKPRNPTLRRFASLLRRSWRQNIRNTHYNLLRLGASVGNALLFGQIFGSVKHGAPLAKSIADRAALLSFGVINMSMMALMKTIHLFSLESPVVGREQERKQYTSLEYLLSKVFAEIPLDLVFGVVFTSALKMCTGLRISWSKLTAAISLMTVAGASLGFAVGSWNDSADSAMALGVPLMVVFMVVGIINPSGRDSSTKPPSKVVEFLQQVSPIKWAIESVCIAEFTGMDLRDGTHRWGDIRGLPKFGAFHSVQNGDQILKSLGLQDASYSNTTRHLAIIAVVNLLLSWLGLERGNLTSKKSHRKRKKLLPKESREKEMNVTIPAVKLV